MDLASFCREEYGKLVGMLTLYCGDHFAAEDLAQEALARTWRKWGRVSKLDDPAAWTRRVAINLANSRFRRLKAERRAKSRLTDEPLHHDPDAADKHAIRMAVAELPGRQRAALVLRYYLDLPFVEVAAIMDIPESTARSLVRRAVMQLRHVEGFHLLDEAADVS